MATTPQGRQVKRKLNLTSTPDHDEETPGGTKHARPGSPGSDGGPPSPAGLDSKGGRYDTSLGLLTKKFTALLRGAPDGVLDLNKAADQLRVPKRRIYDITNVLEGIGLIEKKSKNNIQWKGVGPTSNKDELGVQLDILREELSALLHEERILDEHAELMQNSLKSLSEDLHNVRLAYVTHDDIRSIPSYAGDTLITIKAPSGTTLEVPDPDDSLQGEKRKYQIILKSKKGAIDVFLVSRPENEESVTATSLQDLTSVAAAAAEEGKQHAPEDGQEDHDTQELSSTPSPANDVISTSRAQSQTHGSAALVALTSTHSTRSTTSTGALVRLDPPPMDTDYFFNLDECEGISDLYDGLDLAAAAGGAPAPPPHTE